MKGLKKIKYKKTLLLVQREKLTGLEIIWYVHIDCV